jgi:hypothetical protein
MQRVYGFLALPSACSPSVHGMRCVCHDRLPMLCLSLQLVSSCAHGEPVAVHVFLLCSCLKTSSFPSVGLRIHAQWAAAAVQQTAQCSRHPCFGCTSADAFLDRFDSCSVDDSLQRQRRAPVRVWLCACCARFASSVRLPRAFEYAIWQSALVRAA